MGYPSSVASGGNLGPGLSLGYSVSGAGRQGDGGLLPEALRGDDGRDRCTKCNRVPCVGCGMRACEVCCPMPARLCESCRITSCTPIGALISTVVDKDRFHHKCNTIVLPAEPTADKLREWLSEIKERVRNAFSFDSDYALAWISETERLDYDALGGPCKYPILDSNFTSAIRECIKTRAVRDKMNRLTEAAQNMNPPQGIMGRQILKLLLNHLQTGVEDDQTFKIAELTSLKCRQTGHSEDEARLRSYLSTWDNLISGIRKKIDDGVLLAVFIENVRHLRCMRPDIERWDRDVTVGSFAWLYKACQDCVERWQKRQNTLQMYQTFHEQRSRSGSQSRERDRHPGAPGVVRRCDPLARKSDPSPSRSVRSGRDGRPDGKPRSSSPGRSSQSDRVCPGRGSQRDKRTPSPKSPRRQSPAGPIGRAGSIRRLGSVNMAGNAGLSTTRAQKTPLRPLRRGLAIGPLGTSLCSSDIATTGCMANAQLSRASTCIRSHHQARSPLRLVPLLVRLLRMKRGIPLDRLRPVLPIGRRGVSTAPLKD